LSILFSIALLLWMLWFYRSTVKSILRPLTAILKNIGKIKAGTYDLTKISNTNSEIHALCEELDEMAKVVQKDIETTKENAELEKSLLEMENENLKKDELLAQSEVKMLQNQINPHFLFNTLNNIYALVALNPQQAQYALHSLSQLLRYVLYDNNQQMMPLSKELAFIRSYVELMSLRLSKQVQLEVNLPEDDRGYQVAPLLFIALIENAFKHGVSATEPSFIHISFALTGGDTLICTVENSCFPKNELDRSGSGIGLENLRRRLSLLYPGQHILRMEKIGEQYVAQMVLTLKPHVQDSEIGSK
uniref:sensor histidine kinase n=1 Tax=Alistipes indistinctus TaxID=626932 RepID=UPI0024BBE23C